MSYSASTSRSDAGALIPEDAADEIWKEATLSSYVLSTFKRRRMSRAQQRIPVLDSKATAYFVTGDTGLKQTTELLWTNKYLDAEEIAAIVVIPDNVAEDADFDLWEEYRPEVTEAIAKAIDEAVFFGTNKPTSWPTDILTAAIAAANRVVRGTSAVDFAEDINQVMKAIEIDGFDPKSHVIRQHLKADLRGLRDSQKGFLFPPSGPGNTGVASAGWVGQVYNLPAFVSKMGSTGFATGTGNADLFTLDTDHFVVGVRQDIRMKRTDTGVISDNLGNITYNLFQQDAQALRFTIRVAWQVANPATRMQPTAANRYPAGVMTQA